MNSLKGNTIGEIIHREKRAGDDSALNLTQIISAAMRRGHRHEDVWRALCDYFSLPENHREWSDWTSIDNREEIRLRLRVLLHSNEIDPALNGFIRFFFRASDPVLYQLSAQILGRELSGNPELRDYFETYCKKRGVDSSGTIPLNKLRTRRRVLLVIVSAIASGNYSHPQLPVAEERYDDLTDSDVSILFSAASILIESGDDRVREYITSLLQKRFDDERPIRDRNLVRNAGILLLKLSGTGNHQSGIFLRCLKGIMDQYRASEVMASKLQSLLLFDELMESSVYLGNTADQTASIAAGDPLLDIFLKSRFGYWADRRGVSMGKTSESYSDSVNFHERLYPSFPSAIEQRYPLYAEEIRRLAEESLWRVVNPDERAFRVFFLIDKTIHSEEMDPLELRRLFHSNKLFAGSTDLSPLAAILKRLLMLEPSLSEELIDPQLIHRLDSPGLLPAFLPTERQSELHPVLADAFEHQIRLRLASDPDFDPEQYLYLTTIRNPHPRFYRLLAELTRDREYPMQGGELYPFHKVCTQLAGETEGQNPEPANHFWQTLSVLRKELSDAAANHDPAEQLQFLTHQLRGTGAEQVRDSLTVQDLKEIIHPSDTTCVRRGHPPFTDLTGEQIADQLRRSTMILEEKAVASIPAAFGYSFRLSETTQSIHRQLRTIQLLIEPVLGKQEANTLTALLERLSINQDKWTFAYTIFDDRFESSDSILQALKREGFSDLDESSQKKLYQTAVNTLFGENEKPLDLSLLKRASSATQQFQSSPDMHSIWKDGLTNIWIQYADRAMLENAESDVVTLIKAPELKSIRQSGDELVIQKLNEIKSWCLGRYDISHAYVCNREISKRSPLKTAADYMGHFAGVWVAILLGVIFMFDFGDAWTDLAEMGDAGGVFLLFGVGVAATFLYVWSDLRKKIRRIGTSLYRGASILGRVLTFLAITLLYTFIVVVLFWYLFSETDQVVQGEYAILHMISWTGFALFIGVFLGLIGKDG